MIVEQSSWERGPHGLHIYTLRVLTSRTRFAESRVCMDVELAKQSRTHIDVLLECEDRAADEMVRFLRREPA